MATTPESTKSKITKQSFPHGSSPWNGTVLALVLYLRCLDPQLALQPRFDNGAGIIPTLK